MLLTASHTVRSTIYEMSNFPENLHSAAEPFSMQHRHLCLSRLYVGAFSLAATGAAAAFLCGQALPPL